MAITVGKNSSSLGVQRHLSETTSALSAVSDRLASGLRINKASDDAAGLAIASSLNADTRILNQGIRNVSDGLSYLNIAQGAVEQLSSITTRQLELAEQSDNGVYSNPQRRALNNEAQALRDEYNRIVDTTTFNGRKIYQPGSSIDPIQIQFGTGVENSLSISLGQSLATYVGDGTFTAGSTFNLDMRYSGDFNGDGNQDLLSYIAVPSGGQTLTNYTVQLGNGDGTFRNANVVSNYGQGGIITSDLTGDGITDIAMISDDPNNAVWVYRNNGDGTFAPVLSYNGVANHVGTVNSYASAGDFNGDGILDITVNNFFGETAVFLSNGDGTLRAPVTSSGYQLAGTFGDVNGDGLTDVLRVNNGGEIRLSVGDGTFTSLGSGPFSTSPNVLTDLDGDHFADAILTTSNGFVVYKGFGNGTFAAGVTYGLGNPGSVSFVDVNQDGKLDAIQTDTTSGAIHYYQGVGNGSFVSKNASAGPGAFVSLAGGDFNGDGVMDLVSSNGTTSTLLVGGSTVSFEEVPLDISTVGGARLALTKLQNQLTSVSKELGNIGTAQSRLSTTLQTVRSTSENYQAAKSRIEDADLAYESSQYLALQIKQKVAVSVLAQANQLPALALTLLRT